MADDQSTASAYDRVKWELDAVRALVAAMRRDVAALRAELGRDAALRHVAPWPSGASVHASIPAACRRSF